MSATSAPTGRGLDQPTNGPTGAAVRHDVVERGRRLSTETKSASRRPSSSPTLSVSPAF
jgi:hypothetical protein